MDGHIILYVTNTMISTFLKKNIQNLLSFQKNFILLQSLNVNNNDECLSNIYQRHLSDKPQACRQTGIKNVRFVAQELINNIKLKCCGIQVNEENCVFIFGMCVCCYGSCRILHRNFSTPNECFYKKMLQICTCQLNPRQGTPGERMLINAKYLTIFLDAVY